jgi:hypothetical protein
MMTPMARLAAVMTMVPTLAACARPTSIDVWLDAEEGLRARGTRVHLTIRRDPSDGSPVAGGDQTADVDFPTGVRLLRSGSEPGFALTAELLDDLGTVLSTVRAHGDYVDGEQRELRLIFEAACEGIGCSATETCRARSCIDACVIPALPGGAATPCSIPSDGGTDGAIDGGVPEGGVDAGDGGRELDDAARDAGDAGRHDPVYVRAGVDEYMLAAGAAAWFTIPGTTIELPAAPSGDWLLLVSARLSADRSALPNGAELRYLVGGVERGIGSVASSVDATGESAPFAHFDVVPAETPISVQLRNSSSGTVWARDVSIVALPIESAVLDFRSTAAHAFVAVPGALETTTITAPGRVLVLAAASMISTPATGTVHLTIAGSSAPPDDFPGAVTAARPSIFLARAPTLPASATTIELRIAPSPPSTNVWHTRLLVLDVDALGSFEAAESFAPRSFTTFASSTVVSLDVDDPAGTALHDFVYIESVEAFGNDVRELELAVGDTDRVEFHHTLGPASAALTYSRFDAASVSGAQRLSIGAAAPGMPLTTQEAVIYAIGL